MEDQTQSFNKSQQWRRHSLFLMPIDGGTETQDAAWVAYIACSKDVGQPQRDKHTHTWMYQCMRLQVSFYTESH